MSTPSAVRPARRVSRALLFWIWRYGPSEVVGTALLLVVGTVVLDRTGSIALAAVAATAAEGAGFYGVSGARIYAEQRRVLGTGSGRTRLLRRTVALGVAEFGPIEVLDTFLVRPVLLSAGAALAPDPAVGLFAGKVAADVVFYAGAATAFRITDLFGLRGPRERAALAGGGADAGAAGGTDAGPRARADGGAASAPLAVARAFDPVLREERRAELAARFAPGHLERLVAVHGSPLLLLDPQAVVDRYRALQAALPFVRFHYAVKALDHPLVLAALADAGARFDVASLPELDRLTALGVAPERIIHTAPVVPRAERAALHVAGVPLTVVDNEAELDKAASLPASAPVLVRLAYRNDAAHVDLSAKFGAERDAAERLVARALALGVRVAGFSFHVGSQLSAVDPLERAIRETAALMDTLERRHGVRFAVLDIGGGFPVSHRERMPDAAALAAALRPLLEPLAARWTLLAEPGRCVVADAGIAVTRVLGAADRADGRWVYLDDGVYGSYSNVLTEDVHPLLLAAADLHDPAPASAPVTLAGPTCDSADVIARGYPMPPLAVGDLVVSPVMGAYTAVTACRFNGREPARVVALAPARATVAADAGRAA